MTKHNFDQTPKLLENFNQLIRSSEIWSSDPLSIAADKLFLNGNVCQSSIKTGKHWQTFASIGRMLVTLPLLNMTNKLRNGSQKSVSNINQDINRLPDIGAEEPLLTFWPCLGLVKMSNEHFAYKKCKRR